jgi:hypothetical protein
MQWRLPHPWDGNYAIPSTIYAEPPGPGAKVTHYLPRGTFMPTKDIKFLWNRDPGYALPQYVKDEPVGHNARVTKYLPRRTVSELVPSYLGATEDEKRKQLYKLIGLGVATVAAWAILFPKARPFGKW